MTWSEAQIADLKARWGRGESASVIAAAFGDVSRNAVLGKVHRLKLPLRLVSVTQPMGRKPKQDVVKRARVIREKPVLVVNRSNIAITRRGPSEKEKAASVYANMTKNQLRAVLAQAVLNTAAMS